MEDRKLTNTNVVKGINSYGIYTSLGACAHLNPEDYIYPIGTGRFEGTLQFRCWGKKDKYPVLFCYFKTDDNRKYFLKLWFNPLRDYAPWIEGPNFKFTKLEGSKFYCEYEPFPKRATKWTVARKIEEE